MKLVVLEGSIGRVEPDGSVAQLVGAASLAQQLASDRGLNGLRAVPVRRRFDIADAEPRSVVGPDAAIWGIGLNYVSKQLATGRELPAAPVLFAKARSAVVSPGQPIVVPPGAETVDLEAEIAVMIGRTLYRVDAVEAERAVAGIAAANDVTERQTMRTTGNPGLAKSFPSFGQFGGVLATADELDGFDDVKVTSAVDGTVWQSDSSAGLLMSIGELIARLSHHVVLRPGDFVLSGTPAGTGDDRGTYLRDGNSVEVRIGDLPSLLAAVVSESGTAR